MPEYVVSARTGPFCSTVGENKNAAILKEAACSPIASLCAAASYPLSIDNAQRLSKKGCDCAIHVPSTSMEI
jgi:hypothetical protein